MKATFENNLLTVFLKGIIDSSNAEEVGKEIDDTRNKNPDGKLVLDFNDLEYISSAGLRIILKLKKKEKNLKLQNVSSKIYEILEMTGFSEMIEIEKAYRQLSVDGCKVIGEGFHGLVYRIDNDTIVKVYKNGDALEDIKRERELAKKALVLGVNTAIPYDVVKVGDYYGAVFELLNSKSITQLIVDNQDDKEKKDEYIKIFVDFLREIHAIDVKEGILPDAKARTISWCEELKDKLPEDTYNKLHRMLEGIPSSLKMNHGDYHTNNVHYSNGEAVLIDMEKIAAGEPIFDLANFYLDFQGFSEIDHTDCAKYLKIEWDMCCYIYERFFDFYFEGKARTEIELAQNKAKIVGLVRLLSRTYKLDKDNAALIEFGRKSIIELVHKVDDLII